jgi:hypothetical protein
MSMNLVETVDYAVQNLSGNVRKNAIGGIQIPSIVHSMDVMRTAYSVGIHEEIALKAYVCHDLIEDKEGMTHAKLSNDIGKDAADVVEEMTFYPRQQSKPDYLASFIKKSPVALLGKVIDRYVNVEDFLLTQPDYAGKYFYKASSVHDAWFERREEMLIVFGQRTVALVTQFILKHQVLFS